MATKERSVPVPEEEVTIGRQPAQTTTVPEVSKVSVRIAQLGRDIVDLTLDKGTTRRQAITKAGLKIPEGLEVRVNNMGADLDEELQDGEIITLIPRIRGGVVQELVILVADHDSKPKGIVWLVKSDVK